MKRGKVNRTSVPAIIIMVCVAAGISLFAWYGKSDGGLTSLQENFFVSRITGDTRPLLKGTPAAFRQGAAVQPRRGGVMDSGNIASWIKPAVASVYFRETRFEAAQPGTNAGQREIQVTQKLGSGIVVHPSGYILTNNHLVESADTILVNIAGFSSPKEAKIVFVDPKSDLCILKIDVDFPLPIAGIHRANHLLPGEEVIAVSMNPDLSGEARRAMVSNVKRDVAINGKTHTDLIMLDRKLGSSFDGSPLVDRNGLVVGLLGPLVNGGPDTKSFAVSTKSIHRFLARFMEKAEFPVLVNRQVPSAGPPAQAVQAGLVREAPLTTESNNLNWMGINYQNLEPALARQYGSPFPKGAMVNFVHPFGPAVESDIQPGDIILKANGRIVRGAGDIDTVVRKARGGDVTLQLFRRGKRMEITVPTAPNPTRNRMINADAQVMPGNRIGMGNREAMMRGGDIDRMMANQKKMMIVEKFGLDRSLINQRIDSDRLLRIAKDQMIARKLGMDPRLMTGRGNNRDSAIRGMLHRELAIRLGIDPGMADVPGFGRDQLMEIAKTRILAEKLAVDAAMATLPGITTEEIVQSAINTYIGEKMSLSTVETQAMTQPRPPTAQVDPATQGNVKKDMDRLMRAQRMKQMVSKLDLDPNLLLIPGMSPDRMVKIAGDKYLAAKLGLDPGVTSMPGIDRDRIIQMGLIKHLARKLAIPASLADRPRMTADGLMKIAENRILAGKLGLSSDIINMPGIGRERILRIAGDRMMSSVWISGVN